MKRLCKEIECPLLDEKHGCTRYMTAAHCHLLRESTRGEFSIRRILKDPQITVEFNPYFLFIDNHEQDCINKLKEQNLGFFNKDEHYRKKLEVRLIMLD